MRIASSVARSRRVGSNVGYDAIARMSPVDGSIAITVPDVAPTNRTPCASSCSATRCISRSIVNCKPNPSFGASRSGSTPGRSRPRPSRCITTKPLVPRSSASYCSSRPDNPLLSTSVVPISCDASGPCVKSRLGSFTRISPRSCNVSSTGNITVFTPRASHTKRVSFRRRRDR